jgi:hypothetical protein
MPKITDTPVEHVPDTRADSTVDTLSLIAAEEQAETAAVEQGAAAQEAQEAATQEADLAHEWRGALQMAREIVVEFVPPLDPVWSPDRLDRLAGALARCDQEYGWGGTGQLLGHPLFGLAIAAAPIGWGSYVVVKPMLDEAKAKKLAEQRERQGPPGSMTREQLAVARGAPAFGEQPAAQAEAA